MQMLEDNPTYSCMTLEVYVGQDNLVITSATCLMLKHKVPMGDDDLGDPNDEKLEQLEKVLETV